MMFLGLSRKNLATPVRVALLATAIAVAGCGGGGPHGHDAGPASDAGDGAGGTGGGKDARDTAAADGSCADVLTKKANGQACTCSGECTSTFCVDGVCCNAACTESCKACTATGSSGICTFISAGTSPRDAKTCPKADVSTCGWDGTCDGAGACRRYSGGTLCGAGTCDGDAVVGARSCNGAGLCRPGPAVICAPYSCNPATGACFESCAQSNQCVASQQCVAASCGKKMKGATCNVNADCASGFCADHLCCNVACQGGCVSCALPGRQGTCWPIDPGVPDPRAICKDQGGPSCGTTGACDGFGGCEKYAAETQCLPPSCTGTRRNTPGTCDGSGTCRPQGVQNCSPFRCVDGACNKVCLTDNDCEMGHACVKGLCGPKQNGQPCSAGGECVSTHCVDGICCDTACTGGCRSCSLGSAPGKCTSVAVGNSDPRGVCQDMTAAACATNGKCDGSGGCQKYKMGTICAGESCASNVYKPPSTCNSTGQCTAPDSLPCNPYVCNGTACFGACTADTNCLTPNVCNGNSCGKKSPGASCSAASECQSSFCAQGVCCDKACSGACQSCALSGTLGTCTNVPTNTPDPSGLCVDGGGPSCGTNGKCQAGACQKYAKGTACKDSTCPGTTTMFTPASTCDGNGACVTPTSSSCFPYRCGAAVCKGTCAADGDCASPAVCIQGSCGLKGLGKTCADNTECLSKFCAQGYCCNSSCNGSCQSCGLAGSLGTCTNVPNGAADPQSTCQNKGQASCDTDGVCDGRGACRFYAAGTECVSPTCPANGSTLTQARTCDGVGNCQAASTIACAPFKCNGASACNAACTSDGDCLLPNICDPQTNLCGNKKRLGQACTATADCLTGDFCVDTVCCGVSMCGQCQACNVAGKGGACANVGSGDAEPHGRCTPSAPCGNTGSCNGGGACEQAGSGVSCGAPSCSGSTYTPVSHCTGSGGCATPVTSTCSPYVCGTGACMTTCVGDTDCIQPFTCQGTAGAKSCALKKNGLVCTTGGQCISGNCVDGVCCGSSACPACQACNIALKEGACAPVAAGTPAPAAFCADEAAPSCGANGKCDGLGGCQQYADGTMCAPATCPGSSATLTKTGMCQAGACAKPTASCAPYFCNGVAACQVTCSGDGDCATGYYCTGVGGSCVLKKVNGTVCAGGGQCATGNCVDGFCCGSPSCASCQACNIAGKEGACSPMAAGADDPNGTCVNQGPTTCGTNGKCNGAGACQKYADGTTCSQATCQSTAILKLGGTCSSGACNAGTQACAPFLCAAGACSNACNTDLDCASGTYCSGAGGNCLAKKMNGAVCNPALPTQCAFGNCVDGVCCDTACTGACVSCALAGSAGTCTNVGPGVADPRGMCPALAPSTCSTNGLCDGTGACQKYPAATVCSPATCPVGTATGTLPGTCATGSCAATAAPPCTPYMCGANGACLNSCTLDTDCVPGDYCNGAACVPKKALGGACTGGNQCCTGINQCSAPGNCVDNVCCGSATCNQCESCALPASPGTCTGVDVGTVDPTHTCAVQATATCGTNGKCEADGSCQIYGGGTKCAEATCSTTTNEAISETFCTGLPDSPCPVGTGTDCGAYNCNAATSTCFATCTDGMECFGTNVCDPSTTSCGPP
jgi:hypothetical protein